MTKEVDLTREMSYRILSSDSEDELDALLHHGGLVRKVPINKSLSILSLSSSDADDEGRDQSCQVSFSSVSQADDISHTISSHDLSTTSRCDDENQVSSDDDEEAFENFMSNLKKPAKTTLLSTSGESEDGDAGEDDSMADFIVPDDQSITSGSEAADDSIFYIRTTNLLRQQEAEQSTQRQEPKSLQSYEGISLSSSDGDSSLLIGSPGEASQLIDMADDSSLLIGTPDRSSHLGGSSSDSSLLIDPADKPGPLIGSPNDSSLLIGSQHSDIEIGQQVPLTPDEFDISPLSQQPSSTGERTSKREQAPVTHQKLFSGENCIELSSDSDDELFLPEVHQRGKLLTLSSDSEDGLTEPCAAGGAGEGERQKVKQTRPTHKSLDVDDDDDDDLPSLSESDDDIIHISPVTVETPFPSRVKPVRRPTSDTPRRTVSTHTPTLSRPKHLITGSATEPRKTSQRSCTLLASLNEHFDENKIRHPDALRYVRKFKQYREELTEKLRDLFNQTVFSGKLVDVGVIWNKRLLKTAGRCEYKITLNTKQRIASVELSDKVCASAERVRDTLIHELCHAAVWIIDGSRDGHGSVWQYWARRSEFVHKELPPIRRCHSYEISTKYTYKCKKCGHEVGRHSKSLDTSRFVCARCRGTFELLTNRADGSKTPARAPNKFALYVKENYGSMKKTRSSSSHSEVMKALGEAFANQVKL